MSNPGRRHPRYLYRDQLESLVSAEVAASSAAVLPRPLPRVDRIVVPDTEKLPCADSGSLVPAGAGAGVATHDERHQESHTG